MFLRSGASNSRDKARGRLNSTFSSHWGCVSVPRVDTEPTALVVSSPHVKASLTKASMRPDSAGAPEISPL